MLQSLRKALERKRRKLQNNGWEGVGGGGVDVRRQRHLLKRRCELLESIRTSYSAKLWNQHRDGNTQKSEFGISCINSQYHRNILRRRQFYSPFPKQVQVQQSSHVYFLQNAMVLSEPCGRVYDDSQHSVRRKNDSSFVIYLYTGVRKRRRKKRKRRSFPFLKKKNRGSMACPLTS